MSHLQQLSSYIVSLWLLHIEWEVLCSQLLQLWTCGMTPWARNCRASFQLWLMACLTVLVGKVSTRLLLLFLKSFAKWHLRYATVAPGCHSDWWPACHSWEQKFSKNLHFLDILGSEGSGKFLGAKVQQKIAPLSPLPCLEVAFSCEPFHKLWLSHIYLSYLCEVKATHYTNPPTILQKVCSLPIAHVVELVTQRNSHPALLRHLQDQLNSL